MGFLIFAYRKLFLKKAINDKGYRQMQLQMAKNQILEEQGYQQQHQSYRTNDREQNYQDEMYELMTGRSARANQLREIFNNDLDIIQHGGSVSRGQGPYPGITDPQELANIFKGMAMQDEQANAARSQDLMHMTKESKMLTNFQDQGEMRSLKNQETQIDLEMASLDSQLKSLNAELEGVIKGEDQAAKQDAPHFGLGG